MGGTLVHRCEAISLPGSTCRPPWPARWNSSVRQSKSGVRAGAPQARLVLQRGIDREVVQHAQRALVGRHLGVVRAGEEVVGKAQLAGEARQQAHAHLPALALEGQRPRLEAGQFVPTPIKFQLDWRFEGPLCPVPAAGGQGLLQGRSRAQRDRVDAGNGSGGTVTAWPRAPTTWALPTWPR
jgi:hypothetical protein